MQTRTSKINTACFLRWQLLLVLVLAWMPGACRKEIDASDKSVKQEQDSPVHQTKLPEHGSASHDWCGGHGLPESKCTKCNPELIERFKAAGDWCNEHGFPESACPICNPQAPPGKHDASTVRAPNVEVPVVDWCIEHALPESKCTKCNPELIEQFQKSGDWCKEHGYPESVCPICSPQTAPAEVEIAAIEARVVRLSSPDLEATVGIETVSATRERSSTTIDCTARMEFNADKIADIRAIVPGIVRHVRVEQGATVKRGAVLFELESTRVGEIQGALQLAKERVRTAKTNLDRQRELRQAEIASARQVEIAEQELASAQADAWIAQSTLDMAGASRSKPSGRYVLSSPIAGTVVRRPAVLGVLATEAESLATIADISTMWALCQVPEAHASRIAVGQKMNVFVGNESHESIPGTLTWISAEVDPRTRTVAARAELSNEDGLLRAHQFARAQIFVDDGKAVVAVPRDAIVRVHTRDVVFVRVATGLYEPRVIRKIGDGEWVPVEGRVKVGDAIVTTGAALLRTEILPGSIGAGCCEVEPREEH